MDDFDYRNERPIFVATALKLQALACSDSHQRDLMEAAAEIICRLQEANMKAEHG
jgi:hypothetical protein